MEKWLMLIMFGLWLGVGVVGTCFFWQLYSDLRQWRNEK